MECVGAKNIFIRTTFSHCGQLTKIIQNNSKHNLQIHNAGLLLFEDPLLLGYDAVVE